MFKAYLKTSWILTLWKGDKILTSGHIDKGKLSKILVWTGPGHKLFAVTPKNDHGY